MGEIEESCPDIEIIVNIMKGGKINNSLEININKSCSVKDLKHSLANIPEIGIHPTAMRIIVGDVEMKDQALISHYDVETDDEIFIEDLTSL